MMPDRIKIPSAFWVGANRLNIGRSAILRGAGLPASVAREDASVSTEQFFALWRALEALLGPEAGLRLSQALDGSVLPPSFLVAYHARDYGDALRRVARFKALCAPEALTLTTQDEACIVETAWPHARTAPPVSLAEATLVSLVELARSGADAGFRPLRVELRRAPNAEVAAYFGCPVVWRAPREQLIIDARDLERPFKSYNSELLVILDAALAQNLDAHAAQASLSQQVKWLIRRALTAGRPELRGIARELAISERSLQRRLGEEGLSFQALLSQTRHQLALEHLRDTSLDIAEIAYLLGYDDQGSFYRAFQKWESRTPSEWREAMAFGR
ncbi:HTH-type transcriptional regulator VirS [compost metagenome]